MFTEGFWRSAEPLVLRNTRLASHEALDLENWLRGNSDLAEHLIFRTSGSEASAKYAALSKSAFMASARMVNTHLRVNQADKWLLALPLFHVGGLSILARAHAAGLGVEVFDARWDPQAFADRCRRTAATLTSLVPTQVHDLVRDKIPAARDLRIVLVGGGTLEDGLYQRARQLGWPILRTYGMTEACSQIATQSLDDQLGQWLEILPQWQVKLSASGFLALEGPSLLTGYVLAQKDGTFALQDPKVAGWFETTDHVELNAQGALRFLGRASHLLKIRGELVNLNSLRERLSELACRQGVDPSMATIVPLQEARAGSVLVLLANTKCDSLFEEFNAVSPGNERLNSYVRIDSLPRTSLGKLCEKELQSLACGKA